MDPVYRPGVLPSPDRLRTSRVVLRAWTDGDLACVEEASRDPVIPKGATVPERFTEDAGRAFVQRQRGRRASGAGISLAIVDPGSGVAAGLVTLLHRQQSGVVGLGYWVVASRRQQGLASNAVHLVSSWALSSPQLRRVEALVEPANVASIRVLERVGFQREGLLRRYLDLGSGDGDVLLFALLREDIRGLF